ncbi:MAG TPA: MmgE/PrpD family protein, partial [Candidatus Acidoferrum sp.]|nr:MmgE/PrpD family protein [Candidatus Acidoferrum sp.]
LAVGEAQSVSGEALIVSIALVYEVSCRLADGSHLIPNGWDFTLHSVPAAALAAGTLLGLDQALLTQAVNLGVVAHIPTFQTRVQTLSDWKGLADAQATRDGVFAALLAQQGITGPAPIFEGTHGIFRQLGGDFEIAIDDFGGRGGEFKINETSLKPYPAEGFSLSAIKAALEIAPLIDDLERIRDIQVDTTALGYKYIGKEREKWNPKTRDAADHSMPFIVARALLDRAITVDSYSPAAINDPRVLPLMAKISVREDPALTKLYPAQTPNKLTVRLNDGSTLESRVDDVPRCTSRPEVEEKFRANVSRHWRNDQASRALDKLWRVEELKDISELFSSLVVER